MTTRRLLLLSVLPVLFSLSGCMVFHRVPADFRPVWTPEKGEWPPKTMGAPAGFTITPYQAFEITRKGFHRSLKHQWHLYADSKYYYVHDAFLGDSPKEVHKYGMRIDGRTGKVVRDEKP